MTFAVLYKNKKLFSSIKLRTILDCKNITKISICQIPSPWRGRNFPESCSTHSPRRAGGQSSRSTGTTSSLVQSTKRKNTYIDFMPNRYLILKFLIPILFCIYYLIKMQIYLTRCFKGNVQEIFNHQILFASGAFFIIKVSLEIRILDSLNYNFDHK